MSIFGSFTLKSLKQNKSRTAVSVIGIMLSVGLLTAVFATVTSVDMAMFNQVFEREGGWYMAYKHADDKTIESLVENENTDCVQQIHELGSTDLNSKNNTSYNSMVVRSLPETIKGKSPYKDREFLTKVPSIAEGRMSEGKDEIILPDFMKGDTASDSYVNTNGPLAIGSMIDLNLGVRVGDEGQEDAGDVFTGNSGSRFKKDSDGYLNGGWHYVGLNKHTYKVVGFYTPDNWVGSFADSMTATNSSGEWNSIVGITKDFKSDFDVAIVHATTSGLNDTQQINDLAGKCALSDDNTDYKNLSYPRLTSAQYLTHEGLVRYLGIVDGSRAIYDSLFRFALVLGTVISIASVSLIYNSFAISVAERTRQFGLLSSLGASRKQLRRTVINEALILGVFGIPLGMISGLIGVKVVLHHLRDTFIMMFGSEVGLSTSANILIGIAIASLIILIISAWIPAKRASRVSAVDAIRQTQDVKMSRGAKREVAKVDKRLAKGQSLVEASRNSTLFSKMFGVPGFIAHRNLSRASSKGRVIAASLGISVMLFVVAGCIATYLKPFTNAGAMEGAGQGNADVVEYFFFGGEASTHDMYTDKNLEKALAEVKKTSGTGVEFVAMRGQALCQIPNSMQDDKVIDGYKLTLEEQFEDDPSGQHMRFDNDNNYFGACNISWVSDEYWAEICEKAGITPTFDKPQAIADNRLLCHEEEGKYSVVQKPFVSKGAINLIELVKDDKVINKSGELYTSSVVDNKPTINTYEHGDSIKVDAELKNMPLEISGFIDDDIDTWAHRFSYNDVYPCLIVNHAAIKQYQNIICADSCVAGYTAPDSTALAESLTSIGGDSVYVDDVVGNQNEGIMMFEMLHLFIALFSGIMMLIAVANVFNTLTNSVILRTREFAVLKSVGMDAKAFRKMLICECSSYALKGLILGIGLSVIASYGMFYAMEMSFAGLEFSMPWMHLVIAILGVFAVLALSVRYALVKSKSSNIVEALRIDAL